MSLPVNSTNCPHQQPGVVNILQKILFKVGERMEGRDLPQKRADSNYIIESVRHSLDSSADLMDLCGESDVREVKMSQFVASLIVDCLRLASEHRQPARLLVPEGLPQRLGEDVVRMALDEPCGVRGCSLSVVLEEGETCQRLGKVAVDPGTVTTFEVTVVLAREPPRWLAAKLQALRNPKEKPTALLKPSFKLIKRKLYRRESLLYVRDEL